MSDTESFSLSQAALIALFMESMLFGAFTVLYCIAIWILLYREKKRSKSRLNRMLFMTSSAIWVISVAHLGVDIQRAHEGFITEGGKPNGTNNFYGIISSPTEVAKDVLYITTTLIADTFVAYRVYIVWNRVWWILIVPVTLLLATAVAGYGACAEIGLAKGGDAIFAEQLQPWIRSFFALSLTTNLLATTLIAGRIIWMNRRVSKHRMGSGAAITGGRWEVIETLVQSAAVYSAALASLMGTYLAGSNAQYVCLDILQPLIGIVFTLIIIRVGLGYTVNEVSGKSSNGYTSRSHGVAAQTIGGTDIGLRPMAINVQVSREHDRSSLDMFDRKDHSNSMTDVESGEAR